MSLYTLTSTSAIPSFLKVEDLTIKECGNPELLSKLGEISVEEARKRMANDHVAFVAYLKNEPAAFGWMARGKAKIGELNHAFVLPERHRYLWNFRTLANYRGLGIYPLLLQHIINTEKEKADRFWIIHAPENGASLKGIRKAGFSYVGELFVNDEKQAAIKLAADLPVTTYLNYMGFHQTNSTAASCWNCSSPYLKKRKPTCCCTEAQKHCTKNNLHAFAAV